MPGSTMDTARLQSFIDQNWDDSIIPALVEYIRIPNKSPHFDPQWHEQEIRKELGDQVVGMTATVQVPAKREGVSAQSASGSHCMRVGGLGPIRSRL